MQHQTLKLLLAAVLCSACHETERDTNPNISGIHPAGSESDDGDVSGSSSSGGDEPEPQQLCDDETDCRCEMHTCVDPCSTDQECPSGLSCIGGSCWEDCSTFVAGNALDLACQDRPLGDPDAQWICRPFGTTDDGNMPWVCHWAT